MDAGGIGRRGGGGCLLAENGLLSNEVCVERVAWIWRCMKRLREMGHTDPGDNGSESLCVCPILLCFAGGDKWSSLSRFGMRSRSVIM